ncbi:MAG TPA: tetratricopeptide repeat protein [Gammaproteobacteria bacterium]|nr:tetratricopeptide repeat protein [Gammaproteobacteria bacterium]
MIRHAIKILLISAGLFAAVLAVSARADHLPPGVKIIHVRQPSYMQKVPGQSTYTKENLDAAEELAKIGDAEAQSNLGVMLASNGNYKEAAFWYKKAALSGISTAMYNLGVLYFNGQGVDKSYSEAHRWFAHAAERGNPYAQLQLGLMSLTGQGLPKDKEQEFYWYRKAAMQGLPAAAYNLAVMYHNGDGTKQDEVRAYAWMLLAGKGGIDTSSALPIIAQGMSSDDIAKAQSLSRRLLGDPVP